MKQLFKVTFLVLVLKTHFLQACFSFEPLTIHIHKCDCDSSNDDKYTLYHIQDNYGTSDCGCSRQPTPSTCSCTQDNYNYQYGNSYYQNTNQGSTCGCNKKIYHQENCPKRPVEEKCCCLTKQQAKCVPLNGVSQYATTTYEYQGTPSYNYNSQGYSYNNQGCNNNNYAYSYNNQPYGYDNKGYYNSGDVKKCSFSAVLDGDVIVAEPRDSCCNGYSYGYY